MAYENLEEESAYILSLKKYFITQLKRLFPSIHFQRIVSRSRQEYLYLGLM